MANKVRSLLGGPGFYAVLALCVLAVGVGGYFLLFGEPSQTEAPAGPDTAASAPVDDLPEHEPVVETVPPEEPEEETPTVDENGGAIDPDTGLPVTGDETTDPAPAAPRIRAPEAVPRIQGLARRRIPAPEVQIPERAVRRTRAPAAALQIPERAAPRIPAQAAAPQTRAPAVPPIPVPGHRTPEPGTPAAP